MKSDTIKELQKPISINQHQSAKNQCTENCTLFHLKFLDEEERVIECQIVFVLRPKCTPFEVYFGCKTNTIWHSTTRSASSKNLRWNIVLFSLDRKKRMFPAKVKLD